MRKADIISAIAEGMNITKKDATLAYNIVFDTIKEALIGGDEVDINGFAKFYLIKKQAQKRVYTLGDNKGKPYTIPAHIAPKARFSKSVRDAVYGL